MKYKEKVVLITGAANGIGKVISRSYCEENAMVIMADKDCKSGKKLEEKYLKLGYNAYFYKIDLNNTSEITDMFDFIIKEYSKIDIVINNAAIFKYKPIEEMTIEEFNSVINVNLTSVFAMAKEFIKYNKESLYGRIINIASTRSIMSESDTEAYAASKGGIISLTHALAVSFSKYNVTVNCISPGWIQNKDYDSLRSIDHNQHPSKRVGRPSDIAQACMFLTNPYNDFINGENIVIDGGMSKKMIYEE